MCQSQIDHPTTQSPNHPSTRFLIYKLRDTPVSGRKSYVGHFSTLFSSFQNDAIWHVALALFGLAFCNYVSNVTNFDVAKQWVSVQPVVQGVAFSMLANFLQAFGYWLARRYLLNTRWLLSLPLSIVVVYGVVYVTATLVDYNVCRNQYFYVGLPLLKEIFGGIAYIISSFALVECATKGNEGIMYGLLTTIGNTAQPLAVIVSGFVANQFPLYAADGNLPTDALTGHRMFYLDSVIFGMQLLAVPWVLYWYPSQKSDIQERLASGEESPRVSRFILFAFTVLLIFSITVLFLGIFPSTQCLKIAGGKGC
jgi:hypothetical protein